VPPDLSSNARRTGLVWFERAMWHHTRVGSGFEAAAGQVEPGVHFENAATKRRLKNFLDGYGVTDRLTAIPSETVDDGVLRRFHDAKYIDRIRSLSAGEGGEAGDSTPFGPGSFAIACQAVGASIAGARAVVSGAVDNAYVLVRPPGHHAERDRGRGFCLFGNIALAVLDLLARGEVARVAVVDWDVHHGNGTEQAFYDRDDVLTISLHEDALYPLNTGGVGDTGRGAGEGFNINVPLPPGSGGGAYEAAFEQVVEPALKHFRPELIVVACGFDASYYDPLGHMLLLASHYRDMTERTIALADELCGGRLLVCHEGGYSEAYVPVCGLATIDALRGETTDFVDLFAALPRRSPWQALQPQQAEAVAAAVAGPLARLLRR